MSEKSKPVLLSKISCGIVARASSVLQKNVKQYGPMNALDLENITTCWNSEGSPSGNHSSSYMVDFNRLVRPTEIRLQFQAGFIGEELLVSWRDGSTWKKLADYEVDDDHDLQIFYFNEIENTDVPTTSALKLTFNECSDFYGRVTLYQFQAWGHEVESSD